MKLDRNTNRGGHGKYALVNMRKLIPILDECAGDVVKKHNPIVQAFNLLVEQGIISLGNETPGDQFFVMKYKDMFTADGLRGYADSIRDYIRRRPLNAEQQRIGSELNEYLWQMDTEVRRAEELGNRIPD